MLLEHLTSSLSLSLIIKKFNSFFIIIFKLYYNITPQLNNKQMISEASRPYPTV